LKDVVSAVLRRGLAFVLSMVYPTNFDPIDFNAIALISLAYDNHDLKHFTVSFLPSESIGTDQSLLMSFAEVFGLSTRLRCTLYCVLPI
jgi:hypothetical protein